MITYSNLFNNYDEFKQIFGMVEHGNGVVSRKNKILLAQVKNPLLLSPRFKRLRSQTLTLKSMPELAKFAWKVLGTHFLGAYRLELNGHVIFSKHYYTDSKKGICEDGDYEKVRIYKVEEGRDARLCKQRPGKLLKKIFEEHLYGKLVCEQAQNWICEEFTAEWQVYAKDKVDSANKLTLVVDDDFAAIYNEDGRCDGNFGSCMADKPYWRFYRDYVNASAAYLVDGDDMIKARCIIFEDMRDEDGKSYRYAERQYSSEKDEMLQRRLIQALIAEGRIDAYKVTGAGCGDSTNIVAVDGTSLSHKTFRIDCSAEYGDTVSYQDTFKWLDVEDGIAYNRYRDYCAELDTTDGEVEGGREWDDWHEEYCDSTVECWCNGRCYNVSEDRLDDFNYVEGEDRYYYCNETTYCECCDVYVHEQDAYYSELTEEDYCCESCMERAEEEYKRENWQYSEYDNEYFEDGVTEWMVYGQNGYKRQTIHEDTLNAMPGTEAVFIDGVWYDAYWLKKETAEEAEKAVREHLATVAELV